MKLELKRIFKGANYTIGRLYIDGAYFCDTLEDTVRPEGVKIAGKTAIPAGKYPLELTESWRFDCLMPLIKNVPNFSGVRIHSGNTAEDTEGCILVGLNKVKGKVINSRKTYDKLFKILFTAEKNGEKLEIEIK